MFITVNELSEAPEDYEMLTDEENLVSTKYSYAELETELDSNNLDAGSAITLKIAPISNINTAIEIGSHCTAADSFYTISDESGTQRFSFQ